MSNAGNIAVFDLCLTKKQQAGHLEESHNLCLNDSLALRRVERKEDYLPLQ